MFAIYGIEGRRFRDSMENLRRVREPEASSGTQLRSNSYEEGVRRIPGAKGNNTERTAVSGKAVQAYREMRHLNRREPIYHAYQLMSHPVSTVPIEMGILTAQHYFRDQGFQQMPVVNAQRRLVGMLSVENLLQFMIIDGDEVRYVRGKTVRDAMSQEVITADPVSDIRRIAQVMQEYHLDGVPIVDEQDALIGIVSRNDILRAVINDPPLTMWS